MARRKKEQAEPQEESGSIRLKHTIWNEGERTVYFYEGELTATDGVVEIPADKPEWVRRAWVLGYRIDPDTGENTRIEDLIEV